MLTLEAQKRDQKESLEKLRKEGKMPAVFYGKKTASTPITISQKEFVKIWHKAGESSVVTIKSADGSFDTLIHDVDIDPIHDTPRHVDFYVFEKGKKIEVSVPLEFIGGSPAVKDLGAILIKALHELKVLAEPTNIPHDLKVDISPLVDFGSVVLASDITLPTGVTLAEKAGEVVASVVRPKEEVLETTPVDLSTIEVEKKGKKEEEPEIPAE